MTMPPSVCSREIEPYRDGDPHALDVLRTLLAVGAKLLLHFFLFTEDRPRADYFRQYFMPVNGGQGLQALRPVRVVASRRTE